MQSKCLNLTAMLADFGISPESVQAFCEGRILRTTTGPNGVLVCAGNLYEKERQARLDKKPFQFDQVLLTVTEIMAGAFLGYYGINAASWISWMRTPEGILWPDINGHLLFPGENFAVKMTILDSIWNLAPSALCDADFSSWLWDSFFLPASKEEADRQVALLREQDRLQNPEQPQIEESVLQLLAVLNTCALSRAQLEDVTGFKRSFLVKNVLNPALDAGLIETTEPSRSSPRQRYQITESGRALLRDRQSFQVSTCRWGYFPRQQVTFFPLKTSFR